MARTRSRRSCFLVGRPDVGDAVMAAVTRLKKLMQTLDIHPTVGVGPIRFGMTRAEVRKHLGPPDGDEDDDRKRMAVTR